MQRGLVGCNEGEDDVGNIATGEVVGLQWVGIDSDTGFYCRDAAVHDEAHGHAAQPHPDELGEGNRRIGQFGTQPGAEEIQQDERHDKRGE